MHLRWNHVLAAACLVAAVYFVFGFEGWEIRCSLLLSDYFLAPYYVQHIPARQPAFPNAATLRAPCAEASLLRGIRCSKETLKNKLLGRWVWSKDELLLWIVSIVLRFASRNELIHPEHEKIVGCWMLDRCAAGSWKLERLWLPDRWRGEIKCSLLLSDYFLAPYYVQHIPAWQPIPLLAEAGFPVKRGHLRGVYAAPKRR
jgi:hypothetical protein